MKKSDIDLTEVFQAIASETQGKQVNVRMTETETKMLGFLAKCYHLKKSEVMRRLLHQALVDYIRSDEVMALLAYQYQD